MNMNAKLIFPLVALASVIGSTVGRAQEQGCSVRITAPSNGDNVADSDQVKGSANIPAGAYLWVFAHRKGLALWWPQGGGPTQIIKGGWEVTATFGMERDSGRQFEVVAAVVDQNSNEKLTNWAKRTVETGQYPGIEFPSTVEACKLEHVTVSRR